MNRKTPLPEHPWATLSVPSDPTSITARRVNPNGRWNFFWGRDGDGRSLLLLRHTAAAAPTDRLPRLKGIEVVDHTVLADGPALVLTLRDGTLRDPFASLCTDIIRSAEAADSEAAAVAVAIARTWRWHRLLRGGGAELLSAEEQKGLIGEMLVLESYLLGNVPVATALAAWRGPLGEARDFTLGRVGIESKAHSTGPSASVSISSEFQLDDRDYDELFLHLCVLDACGSNEDGYTVTEVATRIRERINLESEEASSRLDALLSAAGFSAEDDYSSHRWRGGERGVYRVTEGFPRIVPSGLQAGVRTVRYTLETSACGAFLVQPDILTNAICGARRAR